MKYNPKIEDALLKGLAYIDYISAEYKSVHEEADGTPSIQKALEEGLEIINAERYAIKFKEKYENQK
jgi:hypothetical protein